ncbi:MAG: hypothetical protein HY951_03700 [Bacteroidia bacterium]|nr:hypothetical protein [Bacteroidia bacterium]
MNQAFNQSTYIFRKKVFKLFGGSFKVLDKEMNLLLYSEQKAFKLKEDFRIYSDQTKSEELINIKTPRFIDFSATYNVNDTKTGEHVGSLKRKGLKSLLSDEWLYLSPEGTEIGKLKETSLGGALLSRFINLVPQNYIITDITGVEIAKIQQHFNPFVLKYTLSITHPKPPIDRRLILAAGIMLCSIEGRQQ